MGNSTSIISEDEISFIVTRNGAVVKASHPFANMTDYLIEELLGKDIKEIFKMLKIGPSFNFEKIDGEVEYFLFNKFLEIRFVNIQVIKEVDKQLYIFREKPNSRLNVKFPFADRLCSDNKYGIAIFSLPDIVLLKANETFTSFFDKPYNKKENCIGKRIDEFVTGFKGSSSEKIWETILATGEIYNTDEYMYDRLERGITYWRSSLTPIFENGELKYCVEMTTEITNEVLNRKRVEEQNKELEAIIFNMSNSLIVFDRDGNCIINNTVSKAKLDTLSYKNVGDSYKQGFYFDLKGREVPLYDIPSMRVLRGETVKDEILHVKLPCGDRYIKVNGTPLFDDNSEFYMGIMCINDITESRLQNMLIKEQKEELEAVIENIEDAIFVYDTEGKLCRFNTSAKDYFPKEKLKKYADGYSYTKFFYFDKENIEIPDEERPFALIKKGQIVRNYKAKMVQEDKIRYINVSGNPVYSADGKVQLTVVRCRDITEEVKKEQVIRRQQEALLKNELEKNEVLEKTLEMKDEFLSIISHEFRTPLNVINTAIQAMSLFCKDELSDRTKGYIKLIKQNAYRQMRLVNNLLDITRANSGHIKIRKKNLDIVHLTKSITESVNTYAEDKGVTVTFISSVNKRIIGIDEEKYERILLNLISNAVKFSIKDKLVIVKLRNIKDKVCIEVIDKGIGIPKNKIDIIFERFGQVDSSLSRYAEGAGIGLSLVKKLVDALGGSISVKSTEGRGSTFTMMLPNEKVIEDRKDKEMIELLDNRIVEVTNVEFSDIYL